MGRKKCNVRQCPLIKRIEVPYAGNVKAKVVLCGECYSPDTEVLTDQGWKLFPNLNGSELFYSVNPNSGAIELAKAVRYIERDYEGELFHYKTVSVDLLVTPEHSLYVSSSRTRKFILQPIQNIKSNVFEMTAYGRWAGAKKINLSLMKFLGFWLGDGQKEIVNGGHRIRFALKKKRKIDFITKVLDGLKIKYNKWGGKGEGKTGYTFIDFFHKKLYNWLPVGNVFLKRIPEYVFTYSRQGLLSVLDGMMEADGNRRTARIFSSNEELINDFQQLSLLCGYPANISRRLRIEQIGREIDGRAIKTVRESFTLTLRRNNAPFYLMKSRNFSRVPFTGFVYDVTLEKNHVLIVRRNGKAIFSGNSPGWVEEKEGKPFVWKAGNLTRKVCKAIGLDWDELFLMNSARCLIDKDKLSQKQITEILACCRPKVVAALKAIKPKVIIVAGAFALVQILKKKGITKVQGDWIYSKEFDCWCMPCFHPAHCLRKPADEPKLKAAFQRVVDFIENGYKIPTKVEGNYSEIDSLKEYLKAKKPLGIDTECQGLDWLDENFLCLSASVCKEPGVAHQLTLYEECPIDKADFTIKWPRVVKGKKGKQIVDVGVKRAEKFKQKLKELKMLLASPDILLYTMNGNFDFHAFRNLFWREMSCGLDIRGHALDIQAGAHLLDENQFTFASLSQLQWAFTDIKSDYKRGFATKYDMSDMLAVPKKDLINYACPDADVTYQVARTIRSRLLKPGNKRLGRYLVRFVMPTLGSLELLEENGAYIDMDALPGVMDEVGGLMDKAKDTALREVPKAVLHDEDHEGKTNLTRKEFVSDVLFSKAGFGVRPVKKTKGGDAWSIDKEVRVTLLDRTDLPKRARTFIEQYAIWGEHHTLYTRYLKGFEKHIKADGRVHSSFSLTTAVTGRVSSTRPNMQNNPKRSENAKLIRKLIAASPGKKLLAADASQAELRWLAHVANERTMQRIFRDVSLDIHTETAKDMVRKKWATLTEKTKSKARRDAKPVNFGVIYGITAWGFIKYAKKEYGIDVTMEQAETWIRVFFSKYRGIKPYHKKAVAVCKRNGYVESLLGRRRHLPDIYSDDDFIRGGAERMAINQPIQSPSSDACLMPLNEMRKDGVTTRIKPILFIHDENIFEIDENDDEKVCARIVKRYMENPPLERDFGVRFSVPFVTEVKTGYNLQEMTEVKV